MMSSTLVETVSINYEDFNDSFLTCGTCLCLYDGVERTPKLLPCSHTVCRTCLERIVAAQTLDIGSFRCPICRETIHTPQGGVAAFPPSFIVNQLLDLMAQQRRDVIPKCSIHNNQELLFCETCDIVFCCLCLEGSSHSGRGASEHTVIPFAVAIKRMSEIVLFKAHLCMRNLTSAYEAVSTELRHLEAAADRTLDAVNRSFQDVLAIVHRRRHECLTLVRKVKDEKRHVLKEQLELIQSEKERVQDECDGLQYQVEVRNISKKISDLNEKLDLTGTLGEPRENSYLRYEHRHNDALRDIAKALTRFGQLSVSTTFPPLSTARIPPATAHLRTTIKVVTIDYHGNPRVTGGDPITAEVKMDKGELVESKVKDNEDGSYEVIFIPPRACGLSVAVSVFGRPIKDSPFSLEASPHINPVHRWGGRGGGRGQMCQPVRVCAGGEDTLYVLDTGNSRVKVLSQQTGDVIRVLEGEGLEGGSATGLALAPDGSLVVVNWRSRHVSVLSSQGALLASFTSPALVEPIDVTVNSRGEVVVGDAAVAKVFIFDPSHCLATTFGSAGSGTGQVSLLGAVAVGRGDEILVADHRIQVFTRDGTFARRIADAGPRGRFGGVTVDMTGLVLATRVDRGGSVVVVMTAGGRILYTIDSHSDRLRRPAGLAMLPDFRLAVADLGNDCIKVYRYK